MLWFNKNRSRIGMIRSASIWSRSYVWGGEIDQRGMGWRRQIQIQITVGSDKFLVQTILVFIDEKILVQAQVKLKIQVEVKIKLQRG